MMLGGGLGSDIYLNIVSEYVWQLPSKWAKCSIATLDLWRATGLLWVGGSSWLVLWWFLVARGHFKLNWIDFGSTVACQKNKFGRVIVCRSKGTFSQTFGKKTHELSANFVVCILSP